MLRFGLAVAMAVAASSAGAQPDPPGRTIQVTGTGVVSTMPDVATLTYSIAGEGKAADEAARALAAGQTAVVQGLGGLLGPSTRITGGDVNVAQVRDPRCRRQDDDDEPRLSTGDCAVVGYLATLEGEVRTASIDKAATAAGLAIRLGARDARVRSYALADNDAAQRRATSAAIADARLRAQALAAGAGAALGPLLTLRDQNSAYERTVDLITADDLRRVPGVSMNAPPVRIDVTPRPIDTRAQVYVVYAIGS